MEMMVGIAVAFVGLALGACLGLLVFLLLQLRAAVNQVADSATRIAELYLTQAKAWDEMATLLQSGMTTLRVLQNSADVQANQVRYSKPSRFRRRAEEEEEEIDPWISPLDEAVPPTKNGMPEVGTEA